MSRKNLGKVFFKGNSPRLLWIRGVFLRHIEYLIPLFSSLQDYCAPATGINARHVAEQAKLVNEALTV